MKKEVSKKERKDPKAGPYRVGRSSSRTILNKYGHDICTFKEEGELPQEVCDLMNKEYHKKTFLNGNNPMKQASDRKLAYLMILVLAGVVGAIWLVNYLKEMF